MSTREPLKPVYLIWGEDRSTVERAVARLGARVIAEGGLPAERLRAEEVSAEAVVGHCQAVSLAGLRVVVVEGVDRWRAADAAALLPYLEAPNPTTCLALTATVAPTPKLHAKLATMGGELHYGPPPKAKRADRMAWLVQHVVGEGRRAGGSIPPKVAREVVDRVVVDRPASRNEGLTAMELAQEARKLVAYADGAAVDSHMVAELVPRHPDARVYELNDALAHSRAADAFSVLQDLATGDEPVAPIVIQVQMANHFRRLAAIAALGSSPSQSEAERVTGMKGFPVRNMMAQLAAVAPGGAAEAVARLAALELELRVSEVGTLGRSSDDGARLVLEIAVRDLLKIVRGPKTARSARRGRSPGR